MSLKILLLVFALALVSALTYLVLSQNRSTTDDTSTTITTKKPSTVATTSPIVTATTNPTADWKSFTSTRYGYTIKYPKTWFVNSANSEADFTARGENPVDYIGGDTYWSNYLKFNYALPDTPVDRQLVSLLVYKTNKSPDEFFNSTYNDPKTTISAKSEIKINDNDALKFTFTSKESPADATHIALIKVSNGMLMFSYSYFRSTGKDDTATFDSMISTLTFK